MQRFHNLIAGTILLLTVCFCEQSEYPPTWQQMTSIRICENKTNGTLITNLTAKGHNGSPVIIEPLYDFTYDTIFITTSHFGSSGTKASIFLKNPKNIDADRRNENSVDLFFVAYDSTFGKEKVPPFQFTLQLIDVNDNAPIFSQVSYQVEFAEDAHIGTQFTNITAYDPDNGLGGQFTFSLKAAGQSSSIYNNAFKINSSDGTITVVGQLDYERLSFYEYLVKATDKDKHHPLTGSARLVIKVKDIQDMPPSFEGLPYKTSVDENISNGTEIRVQPRAIDGDRGVPNNISYIIVDGGSCSKLFRIDAKSGQIFTNIGNLDRDSQQIIDGTVNGVCRLIIQAKEVNSLGEVQHGVDNANTTVEITINDLDDNLPIFSKNISTATVPENTTRAVLQFTNRIYVLDNDQEAINNEMNISVHYMNGSSFHGIKQEPESKITKKGSISLKLKDNFIFDFEKEKSAKIMLIAKEVHNLSKSATAIVNINILDINDNAPVFTKEIYRANTREENGTSTELHIPKEKTILFVSATDEDTGRGGEITFSLEGEHEHFAIEKHNNTTAVIKTKVIKNNPLDRETKDQYTLTVIATDGEGIRSTSQVEINITDVNDNAPRFQQAYSQVSVYENYFQSQKVQALTKINATDPDSGKGGSFTLSLEKTQELRDQLTSPVLIAYRTIPDDGGPILMIDVNNPGGQSPNMYSETFRLDNNTINLIGDLDYETLSFYQYHIVAKDHDDSHPLTSTATVVILVKDVQDTPPAFKASTYRTAVNENIANGTKIGFGVNSSTNVGALDGDHGVPNGILYTIKPDGKCSKFFRIDTNSGEIFTNTKNLDRDVPPISSDGVDGVCRLTVIATENNSSGQHQYGLDSTNTTVEIKINDLDDNSPKFNANSYHATVPENTTSVNLNISGGIIVSDNDQDSTNNEMTISVHYPNGSSYEGISSEQHTINKNGPVRLRLTDNFKFDFEKEKSAEIKIIAKEVHDNSKSATATVYIEILDINDNVPVFSKMKYSANATEEYGTYTNRSSKTHDVLFVTATDADTGERGQITFTLEGEHDHFTIEANDTVATIKTKFIKDNPLDRETKDKYTITVIATDGEGSRSTAQMIVDIKDVNDNAPKFQQIFSQISIAENQPLFENKKVFRATDNDKRNTNNSKVGYKLLPSVLQNNVSINESTGHLTLKSPLDYENLTDFDGIVNLTVVAYDFGTEALSTSVSFTIIVQDLNDNGPIFSDDVYNMSVKENSVEGTIVGSVSACDADGTFINNGIRYYIFGGVGSDKFQMNRTSGQITVDRNARIDREVKTNYLLTIQAYDTGSPQKLGKTYVNITIIDENDEPPKFSQDTYTTHVNESAQVNSYVIQCIANDPDDYPNLEYFIIKATPEYTMANKQRNQSAEGIFNITGQGNVMLKSDIDREVFSKVTLTVNVTDVNGSVNTPQTAIANINIIVDDSNDNIPIFSPIEPEKLNIPEGHLGGIVFTLSATDEDLSSVLSYAIINDPSKAFHIDDPHTGTIWRNSSIELDRERNETINITVTVNDQIHINKDTITFTLQDINDNAPIFSSHDFQTNVTENNGTSKYNNTYVYNLTATDKDTGVNAKLSYSIVNGNEEKVFTIPDQSKCDIYVNGNIDREKTHQYTLTIIATDNPTNAPDQKTGTTTLTIIINDVNDNSPNFLKNEYKTTILESTAVNQYVTTVTAQDNDAGNFSHFTYHFCDNKTDLFVIDRFSGDIHVKTNLTNKYGNYSIKVEAIDVEGELRNSTIVLIEVKDINNNSPFFVNFTSIAKIYECARNGSVVVTLHANDLDDGENKEVEYSFVGNSPNQADFRINNVTGEIKTIQKLDAGRTPNYKLRVQVKDHGKPRLSSERDITIEVVDINNNPPEFEQNKTFEGQVRENEVNKTILTVKAYDKDSYSEIIYKIISNFNDSFEIKDEKSGNVTIIRPIDREKLSTAAIKLKILAHDITAINISSECDNKTNSISNKDEADVIVRIIDQDDNPPIFKQPEIKKGLRRTVELDTKLLDLEKWILPDPDTKEYQVHTYDFNGNITYSSPTLKDMILKTTLGGVDDCPDTQKTCICLTPNGSLITNMLFEENMKGFLRIPVIVWDGAGHSTATVKLDIISDYQTAAMLIEGSKNFVQVNQQEILNIASKITGKILIADGIESKVTNGIAEAQNTYLYFHAAESTNGPVLSAAEAKELFDKNSQDLNDLNKFNVRSITEYKDTLVKDEKSGITVRYVLMAVCALLSVIIVIVGICFCGSVTRYKRKLKAATTTTNVGTDVKETQPGTNLYARNQNPMFSKEKESEAVDYNRFEDNVSVGSYDSNQFNKKDPSMEDEEKGATMDMYDDDYDTIEDEAGGLAMVVAQHKMEKAASFETLVNSASDNSLHGYDNAVFDSLETTEV